MGKIVVTAFVTLDGVVQAPGLEDEDRDNGFAFGGWGQHYPDPVADARVTESVLAADALLLGRRSYELLSSFWPGADQSDPRTDRLNSQPKYVVSETLQTAEWHNSTILRGIGEIAGLKEQYNEISIWGSTRLTSTLLAAGLIDEFLILTYPVVLGTGKRLFSGKTATGFELLEASAGSGGVVIAHYRQIAPDWLPQPRHQQ